MMNNVEIFKFRVDEGLLFEVLVCFGDFFAYELAFVSRVSLICDAEYVLEVNGVSPTTKILLVNFNCTFPNFTKNSKRFYIIN